MLLAAVGFNANNELEGSSWSLNTARIGHEVGLFDGDPAGADHTPLRREQAMLYAFNTLTKVGQVVWSDALGDYIYGYGDWVVDRYTPETTLGWSVFNLSSLEGIVVGSEGTGEDGTILSETYTKTGTIGWDIDDDNSAEITEINADLDAYMMYRGVRIWAVLDTGRNPSATSVYVNDLSTVNTVECPSNDEVEDLLDGVTNVTATTGANVLTVGDGARYEVTLIDNSAVDLPSSTMNNAYVEYEYTRGTRGVQSTVNDTTVITSAAGASATVDNDDIWTDISSIGRGDGIVYMVANTTGTAADNVYYVYATSATTGTVKSVSSEGVVTLTDGTVLKPSVFNTAANITKLIADVASVTIDAPRYVFSLDSHGHWYSADNSSLMAVAYWTGDVRPVTDWTGVWSSDVEFEALFARVSDGEIVAVPVTNSWIRSESANIVSSEFGGAYYDITDELYGTASFSPVRVFDVDFSGDIENDESDTYGNYRYDQTHTVGSSTYYFTDDSGDRYLYNPSTVVYYVASGYGEDLHVDEYVGNAALISGISTSTGVTVSSVTLQNVAVLTTVEETGSNRSVTVIFGYNGIGSAEGGVLYLPNGIASNGWQTVSDNYYVYTRNVYLNGVPVTDTEDQIIKIRTDSDLYKTITAKALAPGFYDYTIDSEGYVTKLGQTTATTGEYTGTVSKSGDFYVLGFGVLNSGDGYVLNNNVVVKDIRTGEGEEYDGINEVAAFFGNYAEPNAALNLRYVLNSADEVITIYVVDPYTVTVDVINDGDEDAVDGYTYLTKTTGTATPDSIGIYGSTTVTVTLKAEVKLDAGVIANLYYTVNGGDQQSVTGIAMNQIDDYTVTFQVNVPDPSSNVVITVANFVATGA